MATIAYRVEVSNPTSVKGSEPIQVRKLSRQDQFSHTKHAQEIRISAEESRRIKFQEIVDIPLREETSRRGQT